MSDQRSSDIDSEVAPLLHRLEQALAGRRILTVEADRRRTVELYTPLLEDLLQRARRARQSDEVAFLSRQADGLLSLRSLDLEGARDEEVTSAPGEIVMRMPFGPLRRRTVSLADCLSDPVCRDGLGQVLGTHVAATRVTAYDLLLRGFGKVLLRDWGAQEILVAPIPARSRPIWDLYAADLRIVVTARSHARPVANLAPHSLTVSLCEPRTRTPSYIEVRLVSQLLDAMPLLWTGLRWDEEQRLRAATAPRQPRRAVSRTPLHMALASLERRLAELLAAQPPAAQLPWRARRQGQ